MTGYFGPKLENKVIDLIIKNSVLGKFFLEIYLVPKEM